MPKVAIGLPVYNGGNFVAFAIESVLAQTFDDWELVISDNGSTDKTAEICRHYAQQDARIHFFRQEKNQGAAWNFNEVFHRSQAPFFKWLSHDDYLLPESLEQSVKALDAHPEAVGCATATGALDPQGYRILDANPETIDLTCQGLTALSEARRLDKAMSPSRSVRYEGILLYSRRCNEIYGVMRRDVMAQTQLHPSYCGGEKVLLAELALHGPILELPEMLFFVRWHSQRFTSNASAKEQDEHMDAKSKRSFSLPHQYRATLGYLGLLVKTPMPFGERVQCMFVWLRFTLQFRKWAGILINTLRGRATRAEIEGETVRGELIQNRLTNENIQEQLLT